MDVRLTLCGLALACAVLLAAAAVVRAEGGWEENKLSPVELTKATIYTVENAPKTPAPEDLPLVEQVSQYGITWTFDRKVRAGRFITGDWYVVGPVTVKAIDPKPLWGDEVTDPVDGLVIKESELKGKLARNGSVLNYPCDKPGVTGFGGWDSRHGKDQYRSELFRRLPIEMQPGDALISSISRPSSELKLLNGKEYELKVMAVLTCVKELQPADAFRPSFCDRGQTIFLARNLHRERLLALPRPASAPKSLQDWTRKLQLPWIDVTQFGFISAWENMPRYGQWYSMTASHVSLCLSLDYPAAEKEPLLVNYVQCGIDLWGIVRAGHRGWQGHGGYGGGRLWTILFAGLMLDDAEMTALRTRYPKTLFGEVDQTAFGKHWMGYDTVFRSHAANMKDSPDLRQPSEWKVNRDGFTNEGYRRCCSSREWLGTALVARMMKAEKLWQHDAYFAYVDRWMTEDRSKMGELIEKAVLDKGPREMDSWGGKERFMSIISGLKAPMEDKSTSDPFQLEMWRKYRPTLPLAPKAPAAP